MTIKRVCGGFLVVALTGVLAGPAFAQTQTTPPTEAQLLQRAMQYPNDIGAMIDLAKFYVDQRRLEEASRMLARAIDHIRGEQARTSFNPTPSAVTADLEGLKLLRVGGAVREPRKIKDVAPVYPSIAQQAKVQGYVIVEAIIGPDGRVRRSQVIKSQPLLDQAALDAVNQWEYTPPTLDGAPIAVIMSVTVIFTLK
jgi:TonB family protein